MRPLLPILIFLLSLSSMRGANAPRIFFMIGEGEYDSATTLPAFATAELEPRGMSCAFSILRDDASGTFPKFDALNDADLLFISVRRQAPTPSQMAAIRAHVAAGKAIVGIRTASHAFAARKGESQGVWDEFDADVLGGNYQGHHGKGVATWAKVESAQAKHPVLEGISLEEFRVPSHLYKNPHLANDVTMLLSARMEGRTERDPVAWVNERHGRRVFYTSLGSAEDFSVPQFRRLLLNGIYWALRMPAPAAK